MSSTTQFTSELHSQYKAKAYAAASAKSPLAPMTIPRRDPDDDDVQIEILSAVYVILTFTLSVANGARRPLSIHAFLDMRSLAASPRLALQSPGSSQVT